MIHLPSLSMVIGGAASGKSVLAEKLVTAAAGLNIYIATAQAFDDEMEVKIAAHRTQRQADDWHTIEAPLDILSALTSAPDNSTVLIDCMTLWLTNLMLAERDIEMEINAFLSVATTTSQKVVLVTNEVGQGIVPDNVLSRRFQRAQGQLNNKAAAQADLVIAVMAGLPMVLKGKLPAGVL